MQQKGLSRALDYLSHDKRRHMQKAPRELPRRISAVIFDLDDTLVESTVDFAKFKRHVILRIGELGDDTSLYSPQETIVKIIARFEERMRLKGVDEKGIKSMLAQLDRIMDEVELEKVSDTLPIEGASDLLLFLKNRGVKIGILTRGCEEYASAALAVCSMRDLVDRMECRNSKTKAKPDPESYLNLVEALDVPKEETIFVGDHPIDAQCALNAGVPFIAVGTGDVPEETLIEAGSLKVFPDVKHLISWFEEILPDMN